MIWHPKATTCKKWGRNSRQFGRFSSSSSYAHSSIYCLFVSIWSSPANRRWLDFPDRWGFFLGITVKFLSNRLYFIDFQKKIIKLGKICGYFGKFCSDDPDFDSIGPERTAFPRTRSASVIAGRCSTGFAVWASCSPESKPRTVFSKRSLSSCKFHGLEQSPSELKWEARRTKIHKPEASTNPEFFSRNLN